jgi:glycolate oxidase iron-sulfur subunit
VDYGHLVDIGRKLVDAKVQRPVQERVVRWALKEGLTSPLFGPAMAMGQLVRPLLPQSLRNKVPAPQDAGAWPKTQHARRVLMLAGCVQPAMGPNINSATARVLDAAGIQVIVAPKAGCCGAVKFHLDDQEGGLVQMRANIDAWWPYVDPQGAADQAVEALVMNASGCGVTVKEYGHMLNHDAAYAAKAERISALTLDLSEMLPTLVSALKPKLHAQNQPGLVFHPPCSLQHGQKLKGGVEKHLAELGFAVRIAAQDAHLCCGSAGTYSVLQSTLAYELRDRKLQQLAPTGSEVVISANIGCITHLQSGTHNQVRHWVEVLDTALGKAPVEALVKAL